MRVLQITLAALLMGAMLLKCGSESEVKSEENPVVLKVCFYESPKPCKTYTLKKMGSIDSLSLDSIKTLNPDFNLIGEHDTVLSRDLKADTLLILLK